MALFMRELESSVFDEGHIVSYVTLSRDKCISAEDAKQTLQAFKDKHGDAAFTVHAVAGYVNGAYTFKLVDERRLPDVIASMPAGATSHVYSVSGAPFRDLSSRLAAAVNSQAMTLSTQSSHAATFYNKNGGSSIVFNAVEHVASMSGAARRSVTVAPVASAPPPPKPAAVPAPVPLRKAASTTEPAAKAQPPQTVVSPAGSDAASPAAKAEKPKASSAAKKAPTAQGDFFGGLLAQAMAENAAAAKKPAKAVSPVVAKAVVAHTSATTARADSDSDEAEFGSHLPAATRATTRSKGVVANGRDTSHRSDNEDDVDDDVDTTVAVEEREPTAMDTYAASFEARAPLAPGKMLKKVLVERCFENEEGFLVTEHVWEEVEVDVPVNAPVQPPVLRKPAVAPSAAPAVVFTPKTGAPASSPVSEPKKASAGTSKKKAKVDTGPKQASMTAFFAKK